MIRNTFHARTTLILGVLFAASLAITGCSQPEPEKTKGGTYYEGPMKPKSAGGGGADTTAPAADGAGGAAPK